MKQLKRIISLVFVLAMAAGVFSVTGSAAGKGSPVSLEVTTSSASAGYNGIITVCVTVTNNSAKDIKNFVITSSDSKGLCMYRPVEYNVIVTNPGYTKPLVKKDSMTTCLKPGGKIKYVYCVLLGYQYAKRLVPEITSKVMLEQHRLLHTKNFRDISVSGTQYLSSSKALRFGDVNTVLNVKAYYDVKNSVYDKIANGDSVIQNAESSSKGGRKSGIDPDFKAFWDSYVEFFRTMYDPDGYNSAEVLSKYADLIEQADAYAERESELTPEEVAYMLECQSKVAAM